MQNNKKVLFISPTPTHSSSAGNRQHIKSLVSFFKEQNWEVHFLYLAYEDYDEVKMKSFFGNHLYIIPKNTLFKNKKTPDYILKKIRNILKRLKRNFQVRTGTITKEQFKFNSEVDNYFSVFVKPVINSLRNKHHFDTVVCEYASMSKCLTFFDKQTFKILDTHDRFTNRFESYLNNGLQPSWVSMYKSEEKKALKRADLVIAVHESDKEYFSELSSRKSVVFNYVPEIVKLPKKPLGKRLLYIASGNDINLGTINEFIKNIFPSILKLHPDTTLVIGGSICEKLSVRSSNILLKGKFDDLGCFYSLGDIVINPEKNGTGYKVKAMEALCYGMPLLATTAGAIGVDIPFRNHLFIARSDQEFIEFVDLLFNNPELLESTSKNALDWVRTHKENLKKELMTSVMNSGQAACLPRPRRWNEIIN